MDLSQACVGMLEAKQQSEMREKSKIMRFPEVKISSLHVLLLVALSVIAFAPATVAADSQVNTHRGNIAIKGYDTVAYFEDGRAVRGKAQYSHDWNGAHWHFASKAHRDTFAKNPAQYAPQFGGYCAWGVAYGKKNTINPRSFTVRDGKLYLFYSKDFQTGWATHAETLIAQAEVKSQGLLARK